jgi:hypothetical protein
MLRPGQSAFRERKTLSRANWRLRPKPAVEFVGRAAPDDGRRSLPYATHHAGSRPIADKTKPAEAGFVWHKLVAS